MEIAKRAELLRAGRRHDQGREEPQEERKAQPAGPLPPSKSEQDAKLKAEIEAILRLQKEGKTAEAQQLTGKLVAENPALLPVEQTKEVICAITPSRATKTSRPPRPRATKAK